MRIPSLATLVNAALDTRADAQACGDTTSVRHIDKLIANLYRGQHQRFDPASGALIVRSANQPGAVYRVTAQRCSCPSYAPYCTHRRLYDLILTVLDTQADTADMALDPPFDDPLPDPGPGGPGVPGDDRPRAPWYARACTARRAYALA